MTNGGAHFDYLRRFIISLFVFVPLDIDCPSGRHAHAHSRAPHSHKAAQARHRHTPVGAFSMTLFSVFCIELC